MKSVLPFILSIVFCFVGCSTQEKSNQPRTEKPIPSVTPSPAAPPLIEPTSYKALKNFERAWQDFTKDRRFRLAQIEETGGKPFHFSWDDDALVIVVDSSLSENNRLRLAYFKAPSDKSGNYQLYWVAHSCDLAKSYLGNASSDLVVSEKAGRSCFLKWDRAKKEYACRCQT